MPRKLNIILATIGALSLLSSCLKEYNPTSLITAEQMLKADHAGLSNAIAAYMISFSSYDDGGLAGDAGFPAFGIWRDAMTADMPVYDNNYDYFCDYNYQTYIGNTYTQSLFWQRYYYLIQKANTLLGVADAETNPDDKIYVGNALCYRAMAYLDLARMYEYKHTGVDRLDAEALSNGIMGLTVPIVDESTSDSEARENPRVPFYTLYKFIVSDLSRAEECLKDVHSASSKTNACLGVVYGLKARTYLELGTRFEKYPSDIATLLEHESDGDYPALELSSATAAFSKAAEYARKAISEGFAPLSENQWFDPATGFNTPNNAWLWCVSISPDSAAADMGWQSFVSNMSPEASWGIACDTYNAYRTIDAALFSLIPDSDWRKTTWIDPADKGKKAAFTAKYSKGTAMDFSEWKGYDKYCGFKFHPGSGDRITSTTGNAVSVPLMRIEEMYLIEAEAVGHSQGVGAGKRLLEDFVNTYRYSDGSFKSTAADADALSDEIFLQRRIEFWGEGLILWDYRRLEKPIIRDYDGTNHPEAYWFNSYEGAVAPWTNFYIPNSERDFNRAVVLNPDPSAAIPSLHGTEYKE